MKYTLYHPLTTTTWFPSDQNHPKTHKITKSSQHGSRRLAVNHPRQATQTKPRKLDKNGRGRLEVGNLPPGSSS